MRRLLALILIAIGGTRAVKFSSKYNGAEVAREKSPANNSNYDAVDDLIARSLSKLDERSINTQVQWPKNVIGCYKEMGAMKCLKSFALTRLEKSVKLKGDVEYDIAKELDVFNWQKYVNASDDELDKRMARGVAEILQDRKVTLATYPGVLVDIDAANKSLNVDFRKDPGGLVEARGKQGSSSGGSSGGHGNKEWQKQFYEIAPYLLFPGFVMIAIWPFILPFVGLSALAVSIMNRMALSAAIYGLLKTRAYEEVNQKRIIYLNEQTKEDFPQESSPSNAEPYFPNEGPNFQTRPYPMKRPVLNKYRRHNNRRKPWNTRIKTQKEFEDDVEYEIPDAFLNSPSMNELRKGHLFKDMFKGESYGNLNRFHN